MPPPLAAFVCIAFIILLFWLTQEQFARNTSPALWLPISWMAILGSRPISLWLASGLKASSPEEYMEGNLLDRIFLASLILMGIWVLRRRQINWHALFSANSCLLLFYLYLGTSALWSDYPFVSFKRCIKNAGNVVMVLVILTDRNPSEALKFAFLRCAYILTPLSVLFIKYFPDLGRMYNRWTWEIVVTGVTMNKNALGSLILISTLFILWYLFDIRKEPDTRKRRSAVWLHLILLMMAFWLLKAANSATSLLNTLVGGIVLLVARSKQAYLRARHLEVYLILIVLTFLVLHFMFNAGDWLLGTMNRDVTLTGRTEIWAMTLQRHSRPLFGVGYYSFWSSESAQEILETYRGINQAHNGYLETYLDGGLTALALLLSLVVCAIRRLKSMLTARRSEAAICSALLVTALLHNVTEASIARMSIVWFALLAASVETWSARRDSADAVDEPVFQTEHPAAANVLE